MPLPAMVPPGVVTGEPRTEVPDGMSASEMGRCSDGTTGARTVSAGGAGDEGNGGEVVGGGKAEAVNEEIGGSTPSGANIVDAAADSDVVGVSGLERVRSGGTLLCA